MASGRDVMLKTYKLNLLWGAHNKKKNTPETCLLSLYILLKKSFKKMGVSFSGFLFNVSNWRRIYAP